MDMKNQLKVIIEEIKNERDREIIEWAKRRIKDCNKEIENDHPLSEDCYYQSGLKEAYENLIGRLENE